MALYKTGNSVPSSAMPDVWDNNRVQDGILNSEELEVETRTGVMTPTWKGVLKKNEDEIEETRQNLIPLSRQYMTLAAAQADIANIPEGSTTYVRSADDSELAIEYMNVGGTLEPTGRVMASKAYIDEIESRTPVNIDSSLYWGGITAADGAIGVVFSKSDNRPIFGHGGDLVAKLAQVMSESGKITVYPTLAEGMESQAVGDSFVVEMNGQDNLLTPCVFKKETDTIASPIFGITTDREVIHMSKSGYWGGIISGSNQIGIAFRDTDNRAILGNGGDIVGRVEALEQGSQDITTTSDAYGDSILAGTGGTPFPQQLAELIGNGFTSTNYGIGGQRSGQIAMRMGAKPTYLTLSGDAVPANGQSVSITQINGVSATAAPAYPFMDVRLLSTNSNNTTYTLDGLLCGVKCRITRTASGANTDAKIEVYTLTALEGAGVRCLPGSLFTPLYAMQDHSASEMWICAGINDYRSGATTSADYDNDVSAIKENIDAMVNFAERSGRKVLVFGLTNGNYAVEFKDGIRYPKILEVNYYLSQKYPGYYVRSDSALDVREKVVASYDSALSQDVIDFGNDITPSSLRSDNRHPNTAGYAIYAALGYQFRQRRGF